MNLTTLAFVGAGCTEVEKALQNKYMLILVATILLGVALSAYVQIAKKIKNKVLHQVEIFIIVGPIVALLLSITNKC